MLKRSFFVPLGQIDFRKFALVVGTVSVFWLGLNSIVPEVFYHRVSVIIGAVQSAILFAIRGGTEPSRYDDVKETK